MQCYVILYSKVGKFLIFEKRSEAFFFHASKGKPAAIFPPGGTPIVNGPGRFAFPGGALDPGEQPFQCCLREFREECGNAIAFEYLPANKPKVLLYLRNLVLNTSKYPILSNDLNTVTANDYTTLYLEFSDDHLKQIQAIILSTNIAVANQVRRDIRFNEIRDYDSIFTDYRFCPLDDELGDVQIWDVIREINQIKELKKDKATNWYYDMIVFLVKEVLRK